MPVKSFGNTKSWKTYGTRIPPQDAIRFEQRCPSKGDKAKIIRGLIQMFLDNKISKIEFNFKESIQA